MELGGGEGSAVCCFKVSHVLPCLGEWKKDSGDGGGIDMSGVGGQYTKSVGLDYIRFSLCASVPYKSPIS